MSDFAYPLHEECGVFGLYDRAGTEDVAAAAYSALYALQHRGQESCGIAVNDDGVIQGHRDLGLVNEVFTPAVLGSLANPNAHMATGHVRYATSGSRIRANAQPMIVRHGRGTMALCHNGNLTNAIELRRQLENEGAIFHGSSDTEVICYLITRNRLRMGSIETAISKTMDVLEGAYSLVIMSATKLIAVRIRAAKQAAQAAGAPLFVLDGAVIVGTAAQAECDRLCVVTAPFETSVARIVARDGISPEMAARRLNAQTPEETLTAQADYTLHNDAGLEALQAAAARLCERLQAEGGVTAAL